MSMLGLGLSFAKQTAARVFGFVRDGLKAYYRFYETTPDFLLEGSTSFDGTDDYIAVADSNDLSFGDGSTDSAFTISAWIKMDDATSFPIITKGVYASTGEWRFITSTDDKLYVKLFDESVADTYENAYTSSTLTAYEGQWTHVCATYNGVGGTSANAGIKIYLNGSSQSLSLEGGGTYVAMENLGADVHIGRSESVYANGSIANVGIWNRELSASEVESIRWRGSHSELQDTELTNLVSWYDLDSTSLGSDLVDDKTTNASNWSAYGLNEIAVVDGDTIQITHVNNHSGFYSYLRDSKGLTTDLTVGAGYKLTFDAKYTGGSAGSQVVVVASSTQNTSNLTTSYVNYEISLTSSHATDNHIKFSGLGASNVVSIKNVVLKEVQAEDLQGSNDGLIVGATVNTDSYSGTSPFKPRIRDKAQPKMAVQLADGSTSFDGSDDYISLGNDSSLQVGTSDFSLCAWVYRTADDGAIFNWGDIASPPGWQLYESGAELLRFRIDDGGGSLNSYSSTALPEDEWVHICLTMDRDSATGIKMYFNGSDVGVTEDDATGQQLTLSGGSIGAYIGARYGGGLTAYHPGKIANVGLWTRVLTQQQIQEVMFTEKHSGLTSGLKTNLVSWYDLGDTSLGSELLSNTDFSSASGWTTQTGWSISGNVLNCETSDDYGAYPSADPCTVGKTYTITYTVSNFSSGHVQMSSPFTGVARTANGTYTETGTASAVGFTLKGKASSTTSLDVDDVSVKEVLATDSQGSNEGSIYGATTNTGYTHSPHGVVDPLNLGSVYSGTAVSFDGTNDYVGIPSSSAIEIAGDISISCWINADNFTDTAGLVVKRTSGASGVYQLDHNTGGAIRMYTGGDTVTSTTTISTGRWYHIVATIDSGVTNGTKIYINGVQDATTGTCTVASSGSQNLRIGSNEADHTAGYFGGDISSVKIFNLVLTEAQVQEMYLNPEQILPTGVASSNLKLYLPMQEGTGSYVYDGSGNQNHGTLTGATWSTGNNQGYQNALVRSNNPMIFDGSDDYVTVPHGSHLNFGTSDLTISAWVYFNELSGDKRVTYKHSQPSIALNDTAMYFSLPYVSSATADSGTTLAVGQWYHLVMVYDQSADEVHYYVNGSLSSSKDYSGAPNDAQTSALWIGAGDNGSGSPEKEIDGVINEVAEWDEALTASEVTALYNSGTPLVPTADSTGNDYLSSSIETNAVSGDWTYTNSSRTTSQSDPVGGTDAILMTPNGGATDALYRNYDSQTFYIGQKYKFSVWLKSVNSSANISLHIREHGNDPIYSEAITITDTWAEYSISATMTDSTGTLDLLVGGYNTWSESEDGSIYIYNPRLYEVGDYESTDALQGYWRNDNVTTWTDRANTGVASFDGSNDKLTVSHHSSLDPSAISMCGWFKPTSFSANAGIFNKDASGANDGDWNIRSHSTGSGKLEHYVQDGSNTVIIVSDSAITLGAWSHFVITYDGTMKMYINGTLQSDTDTSTCDITNNGNDAQMGCHLTGNFFDGQLAGYHIFNVALSASEVSELYAIDKRASISGHSKFSNCVGSWLMGAGTGDTTSTIQDQTSNNNDATVSGASLVGYNDGTVSGSPADILLPEGTTEGRDTQGFLLSDTTSISNGIRLHGNEYIKAQDSSIFANIFDGGGTVELWVYVEPGVNFTTGARIVTKGDESNEGWLIYPSDLSGSTFKVVFGVVWSSDDGYWTPDNRDFTVNTWHHLAITYDSASASNEALMYVDGVSKSLSNPTPTGSYTSDAGEDIFIGERPATDRGLFGKIDEFRLYDTILSATEVLTNYNNGKSAHS